MLQEQLCQIGFTVNESRVYLELLKLGPQAVSVIASRTKLNRTSTYSILRSLMKKGIVASYKNDSIKFFVANDPNDLIGYIDRKCKSFDYQRTQLLASLPQFRSLRAGRDFQKPVIRYFDGIEGVKHVMYDALETKHDCSAYLALHKWLQSGLKDFLLEYKDSRIFDRQIPLRAIVPDLEIVRNFFTDHYDMTSDMTKLAYVNESDFNGLFENEMNIYGDKVAIINLEFGMEYAVIIESKEISGMHRAIFDLAWKSLVP